jgi:hypothetical protein
MPHEKLHDTQTVDLSMNQAAVTVKVNGHTANALSTVTDWTDTEEAIATAYRCTSGFNDSKTRNILSHIVALLELG